jgi:hypothetical protein
VITLESILTNFITSYMQDCFFCMPAVIIAVRNAEELSIDVQPLPNRQYKDGDTSEYPVLYHVPCIMPYTSNSAILMSPVAGDTVLLMFSQRGIDEFKGGSDTPYDTSRRFMSLQDAVAIIGLSPFSKSPNQAMKHTLPHNTADLTVVHNLGTPNECEVRLKQDGSVAVTASTKIDITAPAINLNGITTINGVEFMTHKHFYPLPTPSGIDLSSTSIVRPV